MRAGPAIEDPASGPAFPAEGNVDAQCSQERLRATQAASECAGIFGPASALTQEVVAAAVGAGPQKMAALPVDELRSAMISRTRVGPSIGRAGATRECASALVRRWRRRHLDDSTCVPSYRRGFVRAASALRTVVGSLAITRK